MILAPTAAIRIGSVHMLMYLFIMQPAALDLGNGEAIFDSGATTTSMVSEVR